MKPIGLNKLQVAMLPSYCQCVDHACTAMQIAVHHQMGQWQLAAPTMHAIADTLPIDQFCMFIKDRISL